MLESLTQKQKIIFFIILLIMVGVIIYYIYSTLYLNNFSYFNDSTNLIADDLIENLNTENIYQNSNIENLETNSIIIYICGAVKENKVVSLKENSRICDAIDAVGGLSTDADITNINLAQILEDGDKIYIPKKGEEIPSDSITSNSSYISSSLSSLKNNKININKASQTELETIPGVGPSTALKIINYRNENGKFKSITDIKKVSGIGEVKYEKIKDYICI